MYLIFPNHCLTSQSGYIIGKRDERAKIVNILDVIPASLEAEIPKICREMKCSLLGYWCSDDPVSLPRDKKFNFVLVQEQKSEIPRVFSLSKDGGFMMILYKQTNSMSLLSSNPLSLRPQASVITSGISEEKYMSSSCPPMPRITAESHLDKILEHVNQTSEISWKLQSTLHPKRNHFFNAIIWFVNCVSILPRYFIQILASISRNLMSFSEYRFFHFKAIKFLTSLPVFFIQFSVRLSQLTFLGNNTGSPQFESNHLNVEQWANSGSKMENNTGYPETDFQQSNKSNTEKSNIHEKQRLFIVMGNVLGTVILDVLLGITLVCIVSSSTLVKDIANNLINYADHAAQLLTHLINWLMGVPGGLKLNKTLTNFLGNFFLYHIYLWQTYLQVIQPYLEPVLQVYILSGCLGLTFLISLASDVFSLLTLHVYFFYVYAARLYSLQIYAIISLARLFTGKKYSMLRNRVDSLPYDVDRLFLGTLLFTILLFLLPTTALFYVVFTTLRLLALLFKSMLSGLTHTLNKIPVFGLVLMVARPDMLPGGLHVEIVEKPSNQCRDQILTSDPYLPPEVNVLYIKLFNKSLSVMQLIDWSINTGHVTTSKQDSWGAFVKKLLCGQLIYPWIERDS